MGQSQPKVRLYETGGYSNQIWYCAANLVSYQHLKAYQDQTSRIETEYTTPPRRKTEQSEALQ